MASPRHITTVAQQTGRCDWLRRSICAPWRQQLRLEAVTKLGRPAGNYAQRPCEQRQPVWTNEQSGRSSATKLESASEREPSEREPGLAAERSAPKRWEPRHEPSCAVARFSRAEYD